MTHQLSTSDLSLAGLGWSPFFEAQRASLDQTIIPARVALSAASLCHVLTEQGPRMAAIGGRLARDLTHREELPTIGDWVGLRPGDGDGVLSIVHVFTRSTCLRRKAAGRAIEAQVLAANVDTAFVVTSLNADLNLRRLERYMEAVIDSGARPVIVLNKADLCVDPARFVECVREVAPASPIALVSALVGDGLGALRAEIRPGETVVLVGSSGVGKSALTNRLLGGALQREGEIRVADDRGRHTTAHRELFQLPGGGLLIDTPGIRELAVWSEDGSAPSGFDDIEALAAGCRFRDCSHCEEPGCAVAAALEGGRLDPARLSSYRKLAAERRYLAGQKDVRERLVEKRRSKQLSKILRHTPKR